EMQELSEAGGFRQAAFISKDFKYTIDENSTLIEFTAPKGSYATTLLREIIKPDDPISAGF
ncbi:MAG: tRNA pseudouridine(13) synthase TruD, partial [Candidatus Nitrosocosmicus sp.]